MKNIFLITIIFFLCHPTLAQENPTPTQVLTEGRYLIDAFFEAKTKSGNSQTIGGSLSYFINDDVTIDGSLAVLFTKNKNVSSPGIGATYYFSKGEFAAPFVKQNFVTTINSDFIYSQTSLGSLLILSNHIGFRPMITIDYNIESRARSLNASGAFTFIF